MARWPAYTQRPRHSPRNRPGNPITQSESYRIGDDSLHSSSILMRSQAHSLSSESCGHSSRPGRSQHPTVCVHWSLRSMPHDRQLSKSQLNTSVQADEAAAAPDCCRGTWSPAKWMPEADEKCVRSESPRPRRTLAASGAMPWRAECRLGRAAALALALTGAADEKAKCMDFGDGDPSKTSYLAEVAKTD